MFVFASLRGLRQLSLSASVPHLDARGWDAIAEAFFTFACKTLLEYVITKDKVNAL